MSGGVGPSPGDMDGLDVGEVASARSEVERALGKAVADKASPRFCLTTARTLQGAQPPPAIGLEQLSSLRAPSSSTPAAAPTIIEFGPGSPDDAGRGGGAGTAPAAAGTTDGPPAPLLGSLARMQAVQAARTHAYRTMGAVYDEVERLSTGALRDASPASASGATTVSSVLNQLCWLNHTVRTFAHPLALAEVAGDDAVQAIDVPRRLVAEGWQPNVAALGVPAFLERGEATGKEIIVAVIDSEVALRHPALAGRVVHRRNFTTEGWGNPHAHGTVVAGIIAADDADHSGIAPGALVYNYKVLAGPISAEDFGGAAAIQLALEDGAVVANCSWGSGPATDGTSREARAVDAAWALGMVVVKSSGNAGPGAATMTSPADAAGIIVVGATDVDGGTVQDYSSRGPVNGRPGPHLFAPGGSFGTRIESCDVAGGFAATGTPGTSFAAPHVTGLVALLAEQHPEWTPDDIRRHLLDSARRLTGPDDTVQGAGLAQLGL